MIRGESELSDIWIVPTILSRLSRYTHFRGRHLVRQSHNPYVKEIGTPQISDHILLFVVITVCVYIKVHDQ